MSKVKSQNTKADQKFKPANLGPAGFTRLEYRGCKYDHANDWMKFIQQWEVHVAKTFPPRMTSVVKFGKLPEIPPVNEIELLQSAPKGDDKVSHIFWESKVKALAKVYSEDHIKLNDDIQRYYLNLWLQLSLSFQNQVEKMQNYQNHSSEYDVIWLWNCIQAICIGTATIVKKTSKISTMRLLTGIKKNKFETIDVF